MAPTLYINQPSSQQRHNDELRQLTDATWQHKKEIIRGLRSAAVYHRRWVRGDQTLDIRRLFGLKMRMYRHR